MTRPIHSPPRRSPGLGVVIALATLVAVATPLAPARPTAAQSGGRLDLVAQTLFLGDEPAEFVLRLGAGDPDPELEVEIFSATRSRRTLEASFEESPTSGAISRFRCSQRPDDCEFDTPGDGLVTIRIPDEEVGELIRRTPGALPVHLTLLDDEGDEADTVATALVNPVDDDETGGTVGIAFLGEVVAPIAFLAGQGIEIDTTGLLADAEEIAARPSTPIAVQLSPENLEALDEVDPEGLASLRDLLGDRELVRISWVDLDDEGWQRAGDPGRVTGLYALGVDTTESLLGRAPTGVVRLDDDATPATLGLLRTVGATAVVTAAGQLRESTRAEVALRPFELVDDNGLPIPAVDVDEDLHDRLADADPELAGYRTLAVLALAATEQDDDRGALLEFGRIDPVALDVLLQGIDDRDELRLLELSELVELDPATDAGGDAIRPTLLASDPPDLTARAADLRDAEGSVDALAAMVAPATGPVEPLRVRLHVASSAELTDEEAAAYTTAVDDDVHAATTGITIAPTDRITLTDRRADLPLTIVNEQTLPLNVELVLSSEKLRFPDGATRTLRLRPGDNAIVIPVETLASGDARITATLTSPGGVFELGSATIDVRSTAISGLGLLISVVALLVLGAWWVRTILRIRRARAAATVPPATAEEPEQETGEPAEDPARELGES